MIPRDETLNYIRGTTVTIPLIIDGKHDDRDLSFVIKQNKTITSSRLVWKRSTENEITATYTESKGRTAIIIAMLAADMADLTEGSYYWDLDSSKNGEVLTPKMGTFNLIADVQTPFDNTDLPEDSIRYFPVLPSEIGEGNFIKIINDVPTGVEAYTKEENDNLLSTKVSFDRGTNAQMALKAIELLDEDFSGLFIFFNTEQNTPYFWNGGEFV